ncbi:MAG TPA: hypothetical protein VLV54_01060 [Thermoanaerobaculia bacterium]|nr:hypothetical protein [Thermoanaerobaculia bacterium]
MRVKIRASMTLLLLLMAGSVAAQFQYTPPGGPEEKPVNRKQALEHEAETARFHLGAVRIAPWLSVHDVAYVRTLLASSGEKIPADFTASVGAGFHAYLRSSPKVIWTAGVLPEYVWWHKQADRRRVNGRYQLGLHSFFNRLTLEATAGREQLLQTVTPEIPVLTSARTDRAEVLVEVEMTRAIFAFTSYSVTQDTNLVDAEQVPLLRSLALLDRKEQVLRGGLRWQPREEISVALGVEGSRAEFERTALPRSNSGTSPLLQIRLHGRALGFEGEIADRSLEAQHGSDFVPFHKVTGRAALLLGSQSRVRATVYGSRDLVYSLTSGYAYLQDDRVGASLVSDLGFHISGRVFAETGKDEYTAFAPGTPPRTDDVTSLGGQLNFGLGKEVVVGVQFLRSRYTSNQPGADRTFSSAGLTINLLGGR